MFELRDNRLAGSNDALLVLEGVRGVRSAEDIEVGFAEEVREGPPRDLVCQQPPADEEETALKVLEEDVLLRGVEQVVHAEALQVL